MNKIFRYAKIAVAALVTVAMAACTSDYEYDTPEALKGAQVYFSNTLPSKIEVNKESGNFDVTLSRQNTEGELTVPLMFTADEGNIYTVPSTVTFADGEATANIHITFNPDDLVYGNYVGGTISFDADNFSTPFGATSYQFKAGASAYEDVEGGKGKFRDGLISALYGIEVLEYDVQIQQDAHTPGIYRVVAPYAQKGWSGSQPWYTAFDENESNTDMIIDATDPDFVYIKGTFNTGVTLNSSDGVLSAISYVQYLLDKGNSLDLIKSKMPELFGTFKDGVFTFPAKSILLYFGSGGDLYYGNTDGMLRVAMPGVVLKDYSVGVEYLGRMTDTNDKDNAVFNLTFGADVTTVKYALVKEGEDLDKTASGIIDGSVEATEISEAGRVEVPFEESGNYYLVTVSYENGEAKGADATPITLKSSKDAEEQFEEVAYGVFTLGVEDISGPFFPKEGPMGCFLEKLGGTSPYPSEATLLQSKSDPTHFRITPWLNEGYDFDFTWNKETGVISVSNNNSGVTGNEAGDKIIVDDVATIIGYPDASAAGVLNSYHENVFTFNLVYHLGDGIFAMEKETFEITATAENAAKKGVNRVAASHCSFNKLFTGKPYQLNKKLVNSKKVHLR
ncbi:MAG: hypothetical protein PUF41_06030 [Prevotella copri]|nr:hypothetical protein [Segatella copri]